jgi:hypothetical protein
MQQVSGHAANTGRGPARVTQAPLIPNSIEGLWILLVANEGELPVSDADGRVPMMARAGDDQTYLLAFKNVAKAREFMKACEVTADARMVVRGNKAEYLRIAQSVRVAGVLIDYDVVTQAYTAAIELS